MSEITVQGELKKYETIIENGTVAVGEALIQIRDKRLYREKYETFGAYCQERWGFKKTRAYQLIQFCEDREEVSTNCGKIALPERESQVRPLKGTPEEKGKAWQKAYEKAGGKQPTAKQVEEAVQEIQLGTPVDSPVRDETGSKPDPPDNPAHAPWKPHIEKALRQITNADSTIGAAVRACEGDVSRQKKLGQALEHLSKARKLLS